MHASVGVFTIGPASTLSIQPLKMKSNEHLLYLFDRYINKTCTAAEKQELMELLADPLYEAQWKMINEGYEHIPFNNGQLAESNTNSVWEAIRERTIAAPVHEATVKPLYRRWWAAAAVALLLISVVGFLWLNTGKQKHQATPALVKDEKPILPGEAGAVLKLDDGRIIVLDSTRNGLVASNAAANVMVENGNLTYQPLKGAASTGEDVYNTMVTMRGKVYRMVLPDGTRVWLNASTEFRYPVAFSGKERRVRLLGEAYFEVAENPSKPFIVEVERQGEVKVLGTHFNVNAYPEEHAFTTTLLEGKVQLSSVYKNAKGGLHQVTLKPDEQCIIRENKDMILQHADMEQTMAWKNGMFVFKSAGLKDVFAQLGRWYDVHFVNEENIDAVYSGSMYRSADFYELLKLIEFTTNLSFRIEGRKVFVTGKK